jgi:hypothetical protein
VTPAVLFERLRALDLPAGDYAIFGSGTLAIRGLIDDPADLDVLCRGAAWKRVLTLGSLDTLPDGNPIVSLEGGLLTFGHTWAFGDSDIEEMIDNAETIDGLPFVRLNHVVAYKKARLNERDRVHLDLIEHTGLV